MTDIIDTAKLHLGLQETAGPNRGPLLDTWKATVAEGLRSMPIPWCGVFLFAMIHERTGMDRKQIASALGFGKDWWPESADSWLAQAAKAGRLTVKPRRGDVFCLMRLGKAGYSTADAVHVGFYEGGALVTGKAFSTVEGNTVGGSADGAASREGTSVATRSRIYKPGAFKFISLPECLSGVRPSA